MDASVEAPESVSTSGSDAGSLSLDQIIDSNTEGVSVGSDAVEAPADEAAEPTTPKPAEVPQAEAKQPEAAKEEKPNSDERYADGALPENWKATLSKIRNLDPAVANQIKMEHYSLAQYKETLPLEEARELRSMFPSLEDARSAQKAGADLMALNFTLANEPLKLMEFLANSAPQAYGQIASEFPRMLFDSDPTYYKDTFAKPITNRFLAHFAEEAKATGNEYLAECVKGVMEAEANWEKSNSGQAIDPRDRELAAYRQRDVQSNEMGVRNFIADVDRTFTSKLRESAERALERADASGLTPDARKMVLDRVTSEIYHQLRNDQYTRNHVGLSARGGNRSAQHQSQIVDFLAAKAKPLLGPKIRESLTWMTDQIVGQNRLVREKETRVATQKPVPTGAVVGSDKGSVEWNKLSDTQKKSLSMDQMLDLALQGRLS